MPKYTVRWRKKTVAGKAGREFKKLGTKTRPKRGTARNFARKKRRDGFRGVTIYDAYAGRSRAID
jgi:hypothetical protein